MFRIFKDTGSLGVDVPKGQFVATYHNSSGTTDISIHDFTDEQAQQALIFFTGEVARRQEARDAEPEEAKL